MRSIETVTLDDARRVIAAGEQEAGRQGRPIDVAITKAFSARAFDVSTRGLGGNAQPGGRFYGIQDSHHGRGGRRPLEEHRAPACRWRR